MSGRLDSSQRFAASEFRYLLDYFDARDYRVVDCLVQNRKREGLSVSFRYDVHLRDVHCAHGFLAVHRERAVAGTFFLLHDYSVPERAHEAEFKALASLIREAKLAGAPVALGLHDSPVDRYLQWRFAEGNEGEYIKWLSSTAGAAFFAEIAQSQLATEGFHAAVTERFVQTVLAAKAAFGDFELSAGHGGKLSQILRRRLPELGDAAPLIEHCFAEHWMTPERLAAAGIVGDVERFKRQVPEVAVITEGGGRLRVMCERLQYYAAAGRPMSALIHPASWGKDVRDAEWSQLLQLPTPPRLRLAVSVSPAQLLKDFAAAASEEPFDLAVCTESAKLVPELASELEARVVGTISFIELIGSARHPSATYDPIFGASLRRYGDFVGATVAAAVGAEPDAALEMTPELSRRAHAFARWLEHEARPSVAPRLTPDELNYFLFSSSQRALVMARALANFAHRRSMPGIGVLVDHGAGIGFIPLVLDPLVPVASVVCSEVKPQFIEAGRSLWEALGMAWRIQYQPVSVVDFAYPADVDAVLFGHMLYRVPPELRQSTLLAAVNALQPGGLLIINELMNRPDLDGVYAHNCLTSNELLSHLAEGVDVFALDVAGAAVKVEPASARDPAFFKRSDNVVVAVRRA